MQGKLTLHPTESYARLEELVTLLIPVVDTGDELNARRSSRLAAKQYDRKKITDGDTDEEDDDDDEAGREDEEAASRQRSKSPTYKVWTDPWPSRCFEI